MKVAAIDIGTNSTRLLVARVEDQKVTVLHSDLTTTRLGEGVDATGCLSPQAMTRTLAAVESFVQQSEQLGAVNIVIAATSAVRDAANREDFIRQVYRRTGRSLIILAGKREAEISYRGVLAGLPLGASEVLVLDVGGGSTEVCWQQAGIVHAASVNVGAVRMTEGGHSRQQIANLLTPVLEAIPRDLKTVVAVGGTATTVAAMLQELQVYQPEKIHLYAVTRPELQHLWLRVSQLPLGERRQLPGLQAERADIIPAGILIILTCLEILNISSFIVSEADILWGLALMAAADVDKKNVPGPL